MSRHRLEIVFLIAGAGLILLAFLSLLVIKPSEVTVMDISEVPGISEHVLAHRGSVFEIDPVLYSRVSKTLSFNIRPISQNDFRLPQYPISECTLAEMDNLVDEMIYLSARPQFIELCIGEVGNRVQDCIKAVMAVIMHPSILLRLPEVIGQSIREFIDDPASPFKKAQARAVAELAKNYRLHPGSCILVEVDAILAQDAAIAMGIHYGFDVAALALPGGGVLKMTKTMPRLPRAQKMVLKKIVQGSLLRAGEEAEREALAER